MNSTTKSFETTSDYLSASNALDSTNATKGSDSFSSLDIKDEDFVDQEEDLNESLLADREIEELRIFDIKEFSPIKPNSDHIVHPEFSADRMYQQPFISDEQPGVESIQTLDGDDDSNDELLDLNNLPDTVTVLRTVEGRIVYLVGTSHFSRESQRDVRRVIRGVQPKIVMLELCRSRMCFLVMNEQEIMKEAQSLDFKKIRDYVKKNGFLQGFIFTVLLVLSAKVAKDLNMAPGGEFRNAFNEALKIPGCSVLLGDRPIDITLRRAMATLSFWQKVKMTWNCFFSIDKLDKDELEKYKQKDVLEQLIDELTQEFPGLKKAMVDERDAYLAYSLWGACNSVLPGVPIVGVVGIGHAAGIEKHWTTANTIQVDELLSNPVAKPSVCGRIIKYSIYGGLSYALYRYAVPKVMKGVINEFGARAYGQVINLISK